MTDQEAQDKKNFLTWYELATLEELTKAVHDHPVKFIKLAKKYAADMEMIHRLI